MLNRYAFQFSALFLLLLSCSSFSATSDKTSSSILFIGNSATYYYGTPYLVELLGKKLADKKYNVVGLFQGGGSLSEAVGNEDFNSYISTNSFDVVVIQEKGGLLLCGENPVDRKEPYCEESLSAHRRILRQLRKSNPEIKTVLLGTSQRNKPVATALVRGESFFAMEIGFDHHVAVSTRRHYGMKQAPDLQWLAEDGVHPGMTTNLLKAIQIVFKLNQVEKSKINTTIISQNPLRSPTELTSFDQALSGIGPYITESTIKISAREVNFLACMTKQLFEECRY